MVNWLWSNFTTFLSIFPGRNWRCFSSLFCLCKTKARKIFVRCYKWNHINANISMRFFKRLAVNPQLCSSLQSGFLVFGSGPQGQGGVLRSRRSSLFLGYHLKTFQILIICHTMLTFCPCSHLSGIPLGTFDAYLVEWIERMSYDTYRTWMVSPRYGCECDCSKL